MSAPQPAKAKIELRPFDDSDWPLVWVWMQQAWGAISDDFSPRELILFVEQQQKTRALAFEIRELFARWRDRGVTGLGEAEGRDLIEILQRLENVYHWGVYRDGELGGLLTQMQMSPRVLQGHCVFKRAFQHRSITIPALEAAQREAWSMGYWKISALIFPDNVAMRRLLLAIGARFEGTLLAHSQREGKPADVQSWAILKEGI